MVDGHRSTAPTGIPCGSRTKRIVDRPNVQGRADIVLFNSVSTIRKSGLACAARASIALAKSLLIKGDSPIRIVWSSRSR